LYKLTQKEKLNPSKHGVLKINTLYLSKIEFDKLNVLTGVEIEKERFIIERNQSVIGIDKVILADGVLIIAEVEFDSEAEMNRFSMPLDTIREVTGEIGYSGFELAKEYSKDK
jgi:CYTH domain-containing protein